VYEVPDTHGAGLYQYRKATPLQAAPTPRRRSRMSRDLNTIADEPNLLASIHELYSCRPEAYFLEPWELQSGGSPV